MDSWIVHAWEVFNSWIVPAWSHKNKELFRLDSWTDLWGLKSVELFKVGLMDRPHVGGVQLMDGPHVEP